MYRANFLSFVQCAAGQCAAGVTGGSKSETPSFHWGHQRTISVKRYIPKCMATLHSHRAAPTGTYIQIWLKAPVLIWSLKGFLNVLVPRRGPKHLKNSFLKTNLLLPFCSPQTDCEKLSWCGVLIGTSCCGVSHILSYIPVTTAKIWEFCDY